MRIKVLLLTVLLAAVSNTNVFSQDMETKKTVTPQGVVENVHKAAELLKTKGKEGLEILATLSMNLTQATPTSLSLMWKKALWFPIQGFRSAMAATSVSIWIGQGNIMA